MLNQLARFHTLCHIATGVSLVVAFFGGFALLYKFFNASFFVVFAAFIIGMVPGFFLMLFAESSFYIYKNYKAQEKANQLQQETNQLLKEFIKFNQNNFTKEDSNQKTVVAKEHNAV